MLYLVAAFSRCAGILFWVMVAVSSGFIWPSIICLATVPVGTLLFARSVRLRAVITSVKECFEVSAHIRPCIVWIIFLPCELLGMDALRSVPEL